MARPRKATLRLRQRLIPLSEFRILSWALG
jgi:hypothetical protein